MIFVDSLVSCDNFYWQGLFANFIEIAIQKECTFIQSPKNLNNNLAGKSCSPFFLDYQTAFFLALLKLYKWKSCLRNREQPQCSLISATDGNNLDFGLFLDFKSVTRNSDSQAEVSKNGLHMSDANVKPVVTPSQMTASGTCMWYHYLLVDVHGEIFFLPGLPVPFDFPFWIIRFFGSFPLMCTWM